MVFFIMLHQGVIHQSKSLTSLFSLVLHSENLMIKSN